MSEPERSCSKCKLLFPSSAFQFFNGKSSGQCRSCRTQGAKASRRKAGVKEKVFLQVTATSKECCICKELKAHECFSPAERGSLGLSAACKACAALSQRQKGGAAEVTKAYRERHPERYLANHRLNMFKRRTSLIAASDGSVTDSFLKSIYATETCMYCKLPTLRADRTLEHRNPLSKGGLHSTSNIGMACKTCNSSKRDLDEPEFLLRLDFDRNLKQGQALNMKDRNDTTSS